VECSNFSVKVGKNNDGVLDDDSLCVEVEKYGNFPTAKTG
jgi:hypothetical protein